jgi:hypothetical protein
MPDAWALTSYTSFSSAGAADDLSNSFGLGLRSFVKAQSQDLQSTMILA